MHGPRLQIQNTVRMISRVQTNDVSHENIPGFGHARNPVRFHAFSLQFFFLISLIYKHKNIFSVARKSKQEKFH